MQLITYCLAIPWIYLGSILPYPVLYAISDVMYFFAFHVVGYRKEIVLHNLRSAFPEKSEKEILVLRKKYYRWFCDMFMETLKTLTISRKSLIKRCPMNEKSVALFNSFHEKNQSVIAVMGHYGAWEWSGHSFKLHCKHDLHVIYQPLSHKYFNRLILRMRKRFGSNLVNMRDILRHMNSIKSMAPSVTTFIADQSPQPERAYWMKFLNQDTGVFLGTERFAKKLNIPVIYVAVRRVKRGYYEIDAQLLFDNPAIEATGVITETHTHTLEKDIQSMPETWLWSHRRWKYKRPTSGQTTKVMNGRSAHPMGEEGSHFFGALLYYAVLKPISLLPYSLGNAVSWCVYFVIYRLIRYRRKVVDENLKRSLPEKSDAERKAIAKKFYKHLGDVVMDGIRAFSMSKDDIREHLKCKNPELVRKYYDQGKDVIVAVGHYNSWELFLTGLNLYIRHQAVVIYQPLGNSYLDKVLRAKRSEYRTIMLPRYDVKTFYNSDRKNLSAIVYAIDQSPPSADKCYWLTFLNQETGVLYGTEKFAKKYDQPVVYARITKEARGQYLLEFVDVSSNPNDTEYGEITTKVTRLLEEDIRNKPEFWLWSHKRWKKRRPEGMELH
jgi:KDO2-lipid IV(A) lauroyltransferase